MVNVEKLLNVLNFITDNPQEWNQENWITLRSGCGTAGCIAGWTVMLEGARPAFADSWDRDTSRVWYKGAQGSVDILALELLGLTYEQADRLFAATNTLLDLWKFAKDMTGGAITVPPKVAWMETRNWKLFATADWTMGNVS